MVKSKTPAEFIADLINGGTAKWRKQRKAEERDARAVYRRKDVMVRHRRETIKEVAYDVMRAAYLKASDNGTLPANARQIYYPARPEILRRTGRHTLDSKYFCQTLLTGYVRDYGDDTNPWNVVWDDRGHIIEPHTHKSYGLGTLSIRGYLARHRRPLIIQAGFSEASVSTCGPDGCFGAVLFIEKEGFMPLFEEARLAEKYDIAVMSSKGMSVTAARELVDQMCGPRNIPLLVLHDFDDSGFTIGNTIATSSPRYRFRHKIKVIDFGLRLADIGGLESESYRCRVDAKTLAHHCATAEEIAFLRGGNRVELNAMASGEFVAFVERKLVEHGIKKVIPDKKTLDGTYHEFAREKIVEEVVINAIAGLDVASAPIPPDIEQRVREYLDRNPESRWETAVRALASDAARGARP